MSRVHYRVAVIGTGNIVGTHLKALRAIRGFDVAGIYGRDYERTRQVAGEEGVKALKSFDEVLSDASIDVVDIASSSDLHAFYGVEAAKKGKNLIIEKPIDASVEKAMELVRQSESNGCLLGVIYQRRFDEITLLLKDLMKRGAFGRFLSGRVVYRQRRDLDYYRSSRDRCKGILINNGIHFIDQIISILGRSPIAVKGILKETRPSLGVEDYALVSMEFEGAAPFTMELASNVKKSMPTIFEFNGERGSIIFWGDRVRFISIDMPFSFSKDYLKLFGRRYGLSMRLRSGTHEDVFRNYLAALEKRERVSVDGRAGVESLKIVDDVYRKAESRFSPGRQ